MATGAAAEQAAQKARPGDHERDEDRGPGSCAGNLVTDPDLRFTDAGRPVSNLRVADTPRIKDQATGKYSDGETVYYDVQVWGSLAENVAQNLQRGDRVVCEGRWKATHYTSKQDEVVERIYMSARDLGPSMIFNGARPERKPRNGS